MATHLVSICWCGPLAKRVCSTCSCSPFVFLGCGLNGCDGMYSCMVVMCVLFWVQSFMMVRACGEVVAVLDAGMRGIVVGLVTCPL